MKELDKVLDAIMKDKSSIIDENAPEQEKEEFIIALREQKRKQIIAEIKEEYEQEIRQEIQSQIDNAEKRKKIDELRDLMWNGLLLAFVVGLAVNESSEIITMIKKVLGFDSLGWTIIIAGVLVIGCVCFYLYQIIKSTISLLDSMK